MIVEIRLMSDRTSQFNGILLLQDLSFNVGLQMRFRRDAAPPHDSPGVCQQLSENYAGRWIRRGRGATVSWPAVSPDFITLDEFVNQGLCQYSQC